ncbi:MAG TPA: type II CRISPR-associated endonuclease Cas1 [Bacilli bacterium]|nr:type II CRISPR-associated endonuclease Cas1 [Bacilli bacterium]
MSWRIVYIEESEYLNLYLDNIKINKGIEDIIIPLQDIHTIILDNTKTVVSVNLLNKCMEYNICLITCGIDHLPIAELVPINGNYRSDYVLFDQIGWSNNIKNKLQQVIVRGKINNQIKVLKKNKKEESVIEKLTTFNNEVELGDTTNREGLAAKMYFRELFGSQFIRFEDDVINAGLNYGYSILRSQITKSAISKGLNTCIGLFHKGASNFHNLSDDIIEPFRPIIDDFVYNNLLNEQSFKKEHRLNIIKISSKKIMYNGQKQTLLNVINMFIDQIIRYIETNGNSDIHIPDIRIYDV